LATFAGAIDNVTITARRKCAALAFHDGILIVHASARLDISADGYRQDPYFYYLTGLENTVGALFVIDGGSQQSWLFLPDHPPYQKRGLQPEVLPGADAAKRLGIDHVVDWSELDEFLSQRAGSMPRVYYTDDANGFTELPANLLHAKASKAPLWIQTILHKYPAFEVKEVSDEMNAQMFVQDAGEMAALRSAAKATVTALLAGLHTIHPGVSQRMVESSVESACWRAGAHGTDFWPWSMAGENAIFPRPFFLSLFTIISTLRWELESLFVLTWGASGDIIRETWAARSRSRAITPTINARLGTFLWPRIRPVWQFCERESRSIRSMMRGAPNYCDTGPPRKAHSPSMRSILGQSARNVPFWQIHATNLLAALPPAILPAGMTINFEPIASVDGQGFFLEDMYLITNGDAELLTPGVPYTAEQIEAEMR
jgi:Xaa-Pro aminopeptidase